VKYLSTGGGKGKGSKGSNGLILEKKQYEGKGRKGGKGYFETDEVSPDGHNSSSKGGKGSKGKGSTENGEITPDGVLCSEAPTKSPTGIIQQGTTSRPTKSPTSSPTAKSTDGFVQQSNPTGPPSSAPVSFPSAFPVPTPAPTTTPSTVPSASPSLTPTSHPSSRPSITPSASPTSSPSNAQCSMTVEMSCETRDGQKCEDILAPTPMCNSRMEIVNFFYDQQSLCSDSDNAQVNTFSEMSITRVYCEDLGTLQQTVSMYCVDSATQVPISVTPQSFEDGENVAVHTNDGSVLPSEILCTISSGGQELQKNWITISGPLRLNDKFGALQVSACGDKHCMHEASATYSITNDGDSTLEVVKCSRDMTGTDTKSFLSMLPINPLPIGATGTVTEKIMLNI